ncbi:MAG TPA: hypothetical protein VJ691_05190 [Vicinamibacterales bacterium]|nr:hypothetical protein [Vicinamibacterales bacterium]
MTVLMTTLLMLAAMCLGLRTTSVLVSPDVHPVIRFASSVLIGGVLTLALLALCRSYNVSGLGLGLLLSLSPVGLFDVAKWWFSWNRRPPG